MDTDLKVFISNMGLDEDDAIDYLEDNAWFGMRPDFSSGKVMLDEEQIELFTKAIREANSTVDKLAAKRPITAELFAEFAKDFKLGPDDKHYISDFLAYVLYKELPEYTNDDITTLAAQATRDLSQVRTQLMVDFLDWCKSFRKTKYSHSIRLKSRSRQNTDAYSNEDIFKLSYYLFSDSRTPDMLKQAAASQPYTDTWLYLTLHFFCSVRDTDLERIYHPQLPKPHEVVLAEIASATFSDSDALSVLMSVVEKFEVLPLTPSKTSSYSNVESVKIDIPLNCEVLIGTLLACAEAHRHGFDGPLVRRISTYEEIKRYMGDEIGALFRYRNFCARSANKAHMQGITMIADHEGLSGALLAAHARSHKGSYGQYISDVTATYLKDGKFTGMSIENIAYQYLQRGVLSGIVSYMLKMMPSLHFDDLTAHEQTEIHKVLGITPLEAERTITAVAESRSNAREIVTSIMQNNSEETIMEALERIVTGRAESKMQGIHCLQSAFNKSCTYPERASCIGCGSEILTKAALFYLVTEYKHMQKLYHEATEPKERAKWKGIAVDMILPKIDEMLCYFREYPEEIYKAYKELIEEELRA